MYGLPRVFLNPRKTWGKKLEPLFLSEYPDFFDSPEIPGDAIVGLFLFGDFKNEFNSIFTMHDIKIRAK